MLVLSRIEGEKIVIDAGEHRIVFTINEIVRNKVRLGIEAARDVQIYREEIAPPQQPTTEKK